MLPYVYATNTKSRNKMEGKEMTMYKAIVTDKADGRKVVIESNAYSKTDFIHDLRRNGYSVNPAKVKTKEVFDYIMQNTNCNPWDWKEINTVPVA